MAAEGTNTQPPKKEGEKRPPSSESVQDRARRIAKREVEGVLRSLSSLLGVDAKTPADLEKHLRSIKEEKEKGLPELERFKAQNAELQGQLQRAQQERDKFRGLYNKAEKERQKTAQAWKNAEVEAEIRKVASEAGFADGDYALHLFRGHVSEAGAFAENPKGFFDSLKASPEHKRFFREEVVAAGPKPVGDKKPEGTAAPTAGTGAPAPTGAAGAPAPEAGAGGAEPPKPPTQIPDQGPPSPGRPGKVRPPDGVGDVKSLDKRAFNDRTKDRYGFVPSRAS